MDEKRLITSFFLANAIDSTSTSLLLQQPGWQELNLFASDKIMQGELYEILILKTAFVAVLIGSFALAKAINSRWVYPIEKALRLGNRILWVVQIWNAVNWIIAAPFLRI